MSKKTILKKAILLFSIVILFAISVNTTFGFIVTKTNSIVNTFSPFENVEGKILISKTLEHPFGDKYVLPENLSFNFKVDLGSFYANTTVKTTSGDVVADENGAIFVSVKPTKTLSITGIEAGTKVTVTELLKNGSGFAVKGGTAVKEGVLDQDDSLLFEYINKYSPEGVCPENIFIKGDKTLEGRPWQKGDTFNFDLELRQGDGSFKNLGTKTVSFSETDEEFNRFDLSELLHSVSFDTIGNYTFRITEAPGKLENIDYDSSQKTFTVKVNDADMDGKLEIESVTADENCEISEKDGKYTVCATFKNTFVPSEDKVEDLPDAPSTGDESKVANWFIVLFVCICVLVVCIVIKGCDKKTSHKRKT